MDKCPFNEKGICKHPKYNPKIPWAKRTDDKCTWDEDAEWLCGFFDPLNNDYSDMSKYGGK